MNQFALEDIQKRYVEFCRNPLPHRNDPVVAQEFVELCAIPEVTAVSFAGPNQLMVGTTTIDIEHPETQEVHTVGEFIIHLYRKRTGKIWDVMFSFENVTRMVASYHHPHISNREIPGFGKFGMLCIQQGQFHIYQNLRSGEMHLATKLLLGILHTYNKRGPFKKLEFWPVRKAHAGKNQ